jgi:hypothetical protein
MSISGVRGGILLGVALSGLLTLGLERAGTNAQGSADAIAVASGSDRVPGTHERDVPFQPLKPQLWAQTGASPKSTTMASAPALSPRDLIDELAWLLGQADPATLQDVENNLLKLRGFGLEGLLAVQQYLLDDSALNSPGDPDDPQIEQQYDLRAVLLDFLLRSGSPAVESLALELLEHGLAPMEVAVVGRFLQETSPGSHSAAVRQAVERAFHTAASPADLPGDLFQLLGETGDEFTLALLASMPMHRDAFASVALALLPDGSGIPLLEQDARLFEHGRQTTHGRLAIALLAQQAHRFPAAADVLLDLAGKNLIPDDMWAQLASLLAGDLQLSLIPPDRGRFATHTIFRPEGDQVMYLTPVTPSYENFDEIRQRLALLDILQESAPLSARRYFTAAGMQLNRLMQHAFALNPTTTPATDVMGELPASQRVQGEIRHERQSSFRVRIYC